MRKVKQGELKGKLKIEQSNLLQGDIENEEGKGNMRKSLRRASRESCEMDDIGFRKKNERETNNLRWKIDDLWVVMEYGDGIKVTFLYFFAERINCLQEMKARR